MLVAPGQWLSVEVISPPRGCLAVSGDALVLTAGGGAPGVYWREARGTAGRLWGTGPPPTSAGGGRGLLWAPLGAGSPGQSVRLQGSLKGGGWLVRQPGGHSQAQARHGGGKRGTGCPSAGREEADGGGGHLHRRAQDGSGAWWGSVTLPAPGQDTSRLRHLSWALSQLCCTMGSRGRLKKPRQPGGTPEQFRVSGVEATRLQGAAKAPAPVCCCVHVRAS